MTALLACAATAAVIGLFLWVSSRGLRGCDNPRHAVVGGRREQREARRALAAALAAKRTQAVIDEATRVADPSEPLPARSPLRGVSGNKHAAQPHARDQADGGNFLTFGEPVTEPLTLMEVSR